MLKSDHFPGCQNKRMTPQIEGAPNYRQADSLRVHGVAIPTAVGIRNVLRHIGAHKDGGQVKVLWISRREERVVYINGRPFVLRDVEKPFTNHVKISEKTSATRSTIIVPSSGISWFLDLFNYYVNSEEHELFSKELQLDSKVFYFDIGENRRGRFLKVSEASVSRNRSTIIVPAGNSPDEGWAAFRNILAEIHEASGLFMMPNQKPSDAQEHLVGLSDDVGAGFIPGHGSQQPSSSEVDRATDLPGQDETGMTGVSKVIRADQKRFFFDLGNNNRGHFLRISEVAGSDRSSIILPLSGLKQFHEVIGHFVEITKDKIEGMTGVNVRTVDPPQR